MQKIVGNNIRKLRTLHGLTLNAFAAKLSLSPSNLSRIERGDLNIKVSLLQKIAEVLGTSPQVFFTNDGQNSNPIKSIKDFSQQFRESSRYINEFSGKTFVIGFTGDIIQDNQLPGLVQDINLLQSLKIRIILVYGIRPQIDFLLYKKSTETLVNNIRVTTKDSMAHVIDVNGRIKTTIECAFSSKSLSVLSTNTDSKISSGNFLTARPLGVINGVDMLFTGQIRRVDTDSIINKLDNKEVVLISPLGYSPVGDIFNLSFEHVASHVAASIKADKLIYYISRNGIQNMRGESISELTTMKAENLLSNIEKNSSPGEAPYLSYSDFNILKSSMHAIKHNVPKVHLINRHVTGSIIAELFTEKGSGTIFTDHPLEIIRQAESKDLKKIHQLIGPLGNKGILIDRAEEIVEHDINHFYVIEHTHDLIGCAALYKYEDSIEIACFAINNDYQKKGYGKKLLEYCERVCKKMAAGSIFVFTTQSEHWFIENGFVHSEKNDMPNARKEFYQPERNSKYFTKKI